MKRQIANVARFTLVVACTLGSAAAAHAREPLDFIPAGSLLCWYGRPLPDTTPVTSAPSTLQSLLELGTRLAGQSLDGETQLGVRIAEMFGLMIRHPHALALIDARALPLEANEQARRVDRLRGALVVQTRGQLEPFLRVIQKAVNDQTSSKTASLETKQAGTWTYQELRDQRLPAWAVIAWGHIDDHFILTIGAGVWPSIAAVAAGEGRALSQDAWYAAARLKRAPTALIEIFVAAREIQRRLDPLVDGRAGDFFRAWDAGDVDQAHWVLGFEGRALYCVAHFRTGGEATSAPAGKTVERIYADPDIRDPRLLVTIPPQARYAIYHVSVARLLPRFFGGLLCIQGPKERANIRRIWAEMQEKHGFNAERDVLAHLGEYVVLHNDPPHPLRIPLAMTTLIEIRDEPATVRRAIETFCVAWRDTINEAAERGGKPQGYTLVRDDDGIWYVQIGPLASIAWTATDRFIISSWSPHALREYLDKVGEKVK